MICLQLLDISSNGATIVIKEESNEQGSSEEHVYIVENNISEQVKAVEVNFGFIDFM